MFWFDASSTMFLEGVISTRWPALDQVGTTENLTAYLQQAPKMVKSRLIRWESDNARLYKSRKLIKHKKEDYGKGPKTSRDEIRRGCPCYPLPGRPGPLLRHNVPRE
jgi:hypothetical protein